MNNIQSKLQRSTGIVTKTETATLTTAELYEGFIVAGHDSTAVVLTIPDGDAKLERKWVCIGNDGEQNASVVYADGFGGGEGTITLLQGDSCIIWWTGSTWLHINSTTAA
ncbi:MAG: hypothetical protein GXY83_15690 [Rhodopirellula sp.]|nr:hypothetical protein [Rhodopirellula sp.]